MSKIISPYVGRKVWFRLNGITELEKPRSGAEMVRTSPASTSLPQTMANGEPASTPTSRGIRSFLY